MNPSIIRINGSHLEGGGQVLRVSAACAVIQRIPVQIHDIRGKRSKPGLKAQHLKGLELVTSLCGGKLNGGVMDSKEVTITPSQIKPGHYHADTQTAGSIMLLLQVALPVTLFAKGPTHLTLVGGTNADMAPPVDYTAHVFTPLAHKFGVEFTMNTVRRGFFPRGGGEVRVQVTPLASALRPVNLTDRGRITCVEGICYLSGLPARMAQLVIEAAIGRLKQLPQLATADINIKREVNIDGTQGGKGLGLVVWCKTDTDLILGASSMGQMHLGKQKSTSPYDIGTTAAERLLDDIEKGVCVDAEMQNQIIIFMGLAGGKSSMLCGELSLHTQTAIDIMQQMTAAKFVVSPQAGGNMLVECSGIGLSPDTFSCNT